MMVCQGFSFHIGGTQCGVGGLVCQHIRETSDLYLENKDEHCKITPKTTIPQNRRYKTSKNN